MRNADSDKYSGMVVALKANYLIVEIKKNTHLQSENATRLLCTRRQKLDFSRSFISVGDYVVVGMINWKTLRGVIIDREKRHSLLSRPSVANVTDIFVFISVAEPIFDFDQASRFLLTAEQTNLNITLVLTKVDLISKKDLLSYVQRLKQWGYMILSISVTEEIGLDILINKLQRCKLSVLCGPSGVGKTSLINYLLPNLCLPTSPVSKKIKRGKNTTRHVELFRLINGSLIADTPGFNRPDINIKPNEFPYLFPEIRSQLNINRCKFRDCLHRDEPGCVIDKNLDRYSFYRNYIDEMINSHHLNQAD